MKFKVIKNKFFSKTPNKKLIKAKLHSKSDSAIANRFAKAAYKELGDFIAGLVLFGSSARKDSRTNDIDILIILDDVGMRMSQEIVQTYRIILAKTVSRISPEKLHIQTMAWTSFWEYVRAGDPVAINILRDGIPLIDHGFIAPLKVLLYNGRIRPSAESVWTYYSLAPASIERAKTRMDMAIVDLYWAMIDSAHAALMSIGEIPPSPSHISEMIHKKLVETGHIDEEYSQIAKRLYTISKKIIRKEVAGYSGKQYDDYRKEAEKFIKQMKKIIEKRN